MKIWIFNNYTSLPEHGQFTRSFYFGKNLKEMGQEPVVFAGSHPHNTDMQLIEGPEKFYLFQEKPFPWVLVKTAKYGKNRKKQVLTMFQYYINGKKAAKCAAERYGKPDVILGSSAHPLAALLAVRLARKYKCRSVVEVRDLWPESIVAYGIAGPHNPAVMALRCLEKWLYTRADAVVFTMEGAYDYIVERGWERDVPRSKVHYINNGVDLETFTYDLEHYRWEDSDLDDPDTIKIVYAGSIGLINNLSMLLNTAKQVKDPRIKFLIFGTGAQVPLLRQRILNEKIGNVSLKGEVEKKYIPSIVTRADYNYINGADNDILRFGISPNKLFDYFAAGKPVLMCLRAKYNPAKRFSCGLICESPEEFDTLLEKVSLISKDEYAVLCQGAKRAAEEYDFKNLTQKLIHVLEGDV